MPTAYGPGDIDADKMAEWDRILAGDLAANLPTPEQWAEARAWTKALAARIQADDENDVAA